DADFGADFLNRLLVRLAGDFDVGFVAHWAGSLIECRAKPTRGAGAVQSIQLYTELKDMDSDIIMP
ncbi:hypothetical protein, partial [Ruegeria halocynthiae]|uniref:hypothetical protein n=1 Tax=Ruegeria halocynthiae TaxID=985054 RepID=UPI001C40AE42